jgi:hypothetical protein
MKILGIGDSLYQISLLRPLVCFRMSPICYKMKVLGIGDSLYQISRLRPLVPLNLFFSRQIFQRRDETCF